MLLCMTLKLSGSSAVVSTYSEGGGKVAGLVGRRVLAGMVTVWLASILVFFLLSLVPGDPVAMMLREVGGVAPRQEEIDALSKQLGFDRPLHVRYFIWLAGVFRGELGKSLMTGLPVSRMIADAMPATIQLALSSMLIAIAISFPAGIISAVRRNSVVDFLSRLISLLGLCVPNFLLALLLMLVFSLNLSWFPVFGSGTLRHVVLPAVTLGTGMAALSARLIRSSMLEVMEEDFIRTARAKGLSERAVICVHGLKCAMIPVVTILGLQLGFALGGSAIVETIFAWPGIGRLMVNAIFSRDFVVVQAVTLVYAVIITFANTLVDVLYIYLDPRIRD